MNERIKALAEQAGLKWKAQPPHYTNTNNPIDFPVSANRDLEKFAKLIAADCADICLELAAKCAGLPSDGALAVDCANLIKQDFEIEL